MWTISKQFKISYAHRVFNQDLGTSELIPKCRNLHGHDSTIIYELMGSILKNDILLDYTFLKPQVFRQYDILHAEDLDHKMILSTKDTLFDKFLEINDLTKESLSLKKDDSSYFLNESLFIVNFVPTAETLSKFLYIEFEKLIIKMNLTNIANISVYFNETSGSTCKFTNSK